MLAAGSTSSRGTIRFLIDGLELGHTAQTTLADLIVVGLCEVGICRVVLVAGSVLQVGNGHRVVDVVNTSGTEMVVTVVLKDRHGHNSFTVG